MDIIKIQLTFTEQTSHGEYRDALYFTEQEWAERKEEEIEKKKQERIDNWINMIEHPVAPPEQTKEQMEQELKDLNTQKEQLEIRKLELINLIANK